MSELKVSIVIPTFDRVGFVEQSIVSVLEQDYENLELLVIDDGSTDETPKILERIAERSDDARFRWKRHENVGQAATLNAGFAEVEGDLLGYLSSDDLLLPGAITKLVEAADAHPEADVIYPWYRIDDLGGRSRDTVRTLELSYVDGLRWGVCVPGVGALVRRRFYERVGGWDESLRFCPDIEWWLRDPAAPFLRVDEVLASLTSHPGALSRVEDKRQMWDERLRVLDQIFARDDLPAEVLAVKAEAYGSVLIEAGAQSYGSSVAEDHRFDVIDRIGAQISVAGQEVEDMSRLHMTWAIKAYETSVDAAEETIRHLRNTVKVLQDSQGRREVRILELENEIRELGGSARGVSVAEATPPPAVERARWKRAVRRMVPPALRPRLIAAYRRFRGTA